MSYLQELELKMTEKIANYDGTEEYFSELEDDLRSWKYVYGSLESARAFLEIARKEGNEKYIESCHQRDKKILAVLEKVCLENMDDLNAIINYSSNTMRTTQ